MCGGGLGGPGRRSEEDGGASGDWEGDVRAP